MPNGRECVSERSEERGLSWRAGVLWRAGVMALKSGWELTDDAHDAVEQRDVLIKVRAERAEVSRQIRNRDVRAHTRRRIRRRGPTCATNGRFGNLLPIVRHGRGVFCLATDRLRAHPRPVRGARLRDRRVHGSKEIGAGGLVDQVQCTMTTAVP